MVVFDANPVTLWPGSVVHTSSVPTGTLKAVLIERAPLDIDVLSAPPGALRDNVVRHATIQSPNAGTVQAALNTALTSDAVFPSVTAQASMSVATSAGQKQLELGLSAKYMSVSLAAALKNSSSTTRRGAVISFTQRFFTLAARPPVHPEDVFGCAATVERVKALAPMPEDLAWVESVSYGKRIMVVLSANSDSSTSEQDLRAAASGLMTSFRVDASKTAAYAAEGFDAQVFVFGGSPADQAAFQGSSFIDKLQKLPQILGREPTREDVKSALPISYQVTTLVDQSKLSMNLATEFDEIRAGRLIPQGDPLGGPWPPTLSVSSVAFHTSGNGRKDNTDYWAELEFRNGSSSRPFGASLVKCRTKLGTREDTDDHMDESVAMESNCDHAWSESPESLVLSACIDPDDEDKWEFEANAELKGIKGPLHFSFRDADAPNSNGSRVCVTKVAQLPARPASIPAHCDMSNAPVRQDAVVASEVLQGVPARLRAE